jgi:putative tricarboxylic transport membrane protein
MDPYDHITSLVWTGVGVGIVFSSLQMKLGTLRAPGPGFIFMLTGIIIVVLSLPVFFKALWLQREKKGRKAGAFWANVDLRKLLLSVGSLFTYSFLLESLGYLITTFFFICFLLRFVERTRWPPALITSIGVAFISYAVFKLWLEIPLPTGPWGF